MKKNHVYHVELSVKDMERLGEEPQWKHMATNLSILAQFVFNIVREYEGDFYQREITLLRLTRYTEAENSEKKINGGYGKGFFGWEWHVEFKGEMLKDINKFKINSKNEKKFKQELISYWKDELKAFDKHQKDMRALIAFG